MKTLKILLQGLGGLCVFACILCGVCQWLLGFGGETATWFFFVAVGVILITELFMYSVIIDYNEYSKEKQQGSSFQETFSQNIHSQSQRKTTYNFYFNFKK